MKRTARHLITLFRISCVAAFVLLAGRAATAETLCDSSFQNCRTQLLAFIDNEQQGIDVGFWFMEDQRYVSHLINRFKAGVPVRLIVDPRANPTYPLNATSLDALKQAGIPMVKKTAGGIMHWKAMIFSGQNIVEFGSANYSDNAFVPVTPYSNYVSETIFFENDSDIVESFMRKFDDLWVDTANYSVYANVTSRVRTHGLFTISADMNFPPNQDFGARSVARYNAETAQIDVIMYRITDQRHSDAMIAAHKRGVKVRYLGETNEYRLAERLWVAWNMDRMYAAGIPMRVRASAGENHEKVVLLHAQHLTIFGSSNWTGPSATSQAEHNYFTTKANIFTWFDAQFERKWNNSKSIAETKPFTPLPPDKPVYHGIANGATGVPTSGQSLAWYGGPWAHVYDIYLGTDPNTIPLFAANQALGPSESTSELQRFTLPTLKSGTTYYWKIVSKTAANLSREGSVASFTTAGSVPPPTNGATTVVIWTSRIATTAIHGNWQRVSDSTAAGSVALRNTDAGAAKIDPALASPKNYFEATFLAPKQTPYHLWVRLKAQGDSLKNDSIHVQFSDSTDSGGASVTRIGTTSSAEVVQQAGDADTTDHGWGWSDNGWNQLGPNIYFATTGSHTIRIQQREDGATIDQIVLSPGKYVSSPPGGHDNDATILQPAGGSTGTTTTAAITSGTEGVLARASGLSGTPTQDAADPEDLRAAFAVAPSPPRPSRWRDRSLT